MFLYTKKYDQSKMSEELAAKIAASMAFISVLESMADDPITNEPGMPITEKELDLLTAAKRNIISEVIDFVHANLSELMMKVKKNERHN